MNVEAHRGFQLWFFYLDRALSGPTNVARSQFSTGAAAAFCCLCMDRRIKFDEDKEEG